MLKRRFLLDSSWIDLEKMRKTFSRGSRVKKLDFLRFFLRHGEVKPLEYLSKLKKTSIGLCLIQLFSRIFSSFSANSTTFENSFSNCSTFSGFVPKHSDFCRNSSWESIKFKVFRTSTWLFSSPSNSERKKKFFLFFTENNGKATILFETFLFRHFKMKTSSDRSTTLIFFFQKYFRVMINSIFLFQRRISSRICEMWTQLEYHQS